MLVVFRSSAERLLFTSQALCELAQSDRPENPPKVASCARNCLKVAGNSDWRLLGLSRSYQPLRIPSSVVSFSSPGWFGEDDTTCGPPAAAAAAAAAAVT